MNVSSIIMGVIGVILIYYLYVYFSSSVTTLATVIDCSTGSSYIDGSKISGATSSNFGFGIWVYINNWYNTGSSTGITNIFCRNGSSTTTNALQVFMDSSSPNLWVQFAAPASSGSSYSKITTASSPNNAAILVTNSFPLQKWVYIFVSVDSGMYVDIYLDGKMVKTTVLTYPTFGQAATSSTGSTPGITVGPFAGYITTFQSFGYAVDPQTVWNYYMKGNGMALGTNYGVSMNILKNETTQSSYRLF
jgi:hypothetical protein